MRHVASLLLLSIFAANGSVANENEAVPLQDYIPQAYFSYNAGPRHAPSVAINSEAEWKEFWAQAERGDTNDESAQETHPLPKVNFKRHTLLVIALGSRSYGGFGVAFGPIRQSSSETHVTAYELTPGPRCIMAAIVTYPIAYAVIPRTNKPVRFDTTKAVIDCS